MSKYILIILLGFGCFGVVGDEETVEKLGDILSHYECNGMLFSQASSGLADKPRNKGFVSISIFAGQGSEKIDGKDFAWFFSRFPYEWGFKTHFFNKPPEFDTYATTYKEGGYLTEDEYYWFRRSIKPEEGVKQRLVSLKFNERFKNFSYEKLSTYETRRFSSLREYANGNCELVKKSFNYKYE